MKKYKPSYSWLTVGTYKSRRGVLQTACCGIKKKFSPKFNLQNLIHWLKIPHPNMPLRFVAWIDFNFKGTTGLQTTARSCFNKSCNWARDCSSFMSQLIIRNTPVLLSVMFSCSYTYNKYQPSKDWNSYWRALDISHLTHLTKTPKSTCQNETNTLALFCLWK